MPSECSNASWKTWTPLPDRFIDVHLVEMFPLFDQARLQLVNVMNPAAIHAPAASRKSGLLGNSATNFSHRILSPASAL